MSNTNNQKSCINFVWCINAEKFSTLEKIITGEELEIEDIIPNFTTQENDYYYAQNIASWAINYPNNIVRLVYHPVYMHKKVHIGESQYIKNKEEIDSNASHVDNLIKDLRLLSSNKVTETIRKAYEQKLQKKYNINLTLDEIEQKYRDGFAKFEKKMHDHGYKNFQIINYKDLVLSNLSQQELQLHPYMNELLENRIMSIANNLDYIKTSINYFGFGYEKNLTMDMDMTPFSMRENGLVEFEETSVKFAHRPEQIQAIYTDHSKDQFFLKPLIEMINKQNPHSVSPQITDPYYYHKLNHSVRFDIVSEYFMDHAEYPLPKYYMNNIVKFGNSHITNIVGNTETISFQKNYWPQNNKINYSPYLNNETWSSLVLLLIFLPFMLLIRYRLVRFFEKYIIGKFSI